MTAVIIFCNMQFQYRSYVETEPLLTVQLILIFFSTFWSITPYKFLTTKVFQLN